VESARQIETPEPADGTAQAGLQASSSIGIGPETRVVVSVELYGVIRDLVKDHNVEVRLTKRGRASFRDVLDELVDRYGPAFRDRLFGSDGLLGYVRVYADGRPVEDLSEPLPAGDEPAVRIIVMAAAGGG
jgi:molybdopterin converting factor small subunit